MEFVVSNRMSKIKGSAIREIFKYAADPNVISLAGGNPDPALFPNKELSVIAKNILEKEPVLALQYGITEGYMPLRETIKKRLKSIENIGNDYDELVVMSGGQQGIELTCKNLVNEGDTVIVELPSFIGATNAFRSYGANLVGVPVLEDGMDLDYLEKVIKENKNIKLIYTIPTFQNPMGVTMSIEKRKKLLKIAEENNIHILEDNPYGELCFNGEKTPTIKSFDKTGTVIYAGSFSKILAPGLRLGFLIGDKNIISKVTVAKQVSDVHTPMLPQLLAYEYMKNYSIDDLIKKMRETYKHKCQTMINAMEEYFDSSVYYTRPNGGLFIWCDLKHGIDSLALSKKAIEKKVVYVPGNTFMVDMDAPCSALRLNYSTMDDEHIVEGIKCLAPVFNEAIKEAENN